MKTSAKKCSILLSLASTAGLALPAARAVVIQYNPVVTVVHANTSTPNYNTTGFAVSINLYNNGNGTPGLLASVTYNNSTTGGTHDVNLVDYAGTPFARLNNNPALVNAAESGQAYTGTAYAYSPGYNATAGTTTVAAAANTADRVIGAVTLGPGTLGSPTIVSSASYTSLYAQPSGTSSFNAVVGDDSASNFWTVGTSSASAATTGLQYSSPSTNPVRITSLLERTLALQGGYLFVGATNGVSVFAQNFNNPPKTPVALTTLFATLVEMNQFAMLDDPKNSNSIYGINTIYAADYTGSASAGEGIFKYVYDGSSWTQQYDIEPGKTGSVVGPGPTFGFDGLAGQYDPSTGDEILYATTATFGIGGPTSSLYQIVDQVNGGTLASANASDTLLATAPAGSTFGGVALDPVSVPEPADLGILGILLASAGLLRPRSPVRRAHGQAV